MTGKAGLRDHIRKEAPRLFFERAFFLEGLFSSVSLVFVT